MQKVMDATEFSWQQQLQNRRSQEVPIYLSINSVNYFRESQCV